MSNGWLLLFPPQAKVCDLDLLMKIFSDAAGFLGVEAADEASAIELYDAVSMCGTVQGIVTVNEDGHLISFDNVV